MSHKEINERKRNMLVLAAIAIETPFNVCVKSNKIMKMLLESKLGEFATVELNIWFLIYIKSFVIAFFPSLICTRARVWVLLLTATMPKCEAD